MQIKYRLEIDGFEIEAEIKVKDKIVNGFLKFFEINTLESLTEYRVNILLLHCNKV